VTIVTVGWRNALRNKLRTAMTATGVAVTVVAFVLLRTILVAWSAGAEHAAKDRLSTRNRVSFGLPLPKRYIDEIRRVPGVKSTTYCDWFGGKWTKRPDEFFANLACADDAFDVYPEVTVDPAVLEAWKRTKDGVIVGDRLAKKLGVEVGDRMTLEGTFYPGFWDFLVVGVYTAPERSSVDRSSFFFRWEYKNDGVLPDQKDRIGWIFTRIDDPSRSAAIARSIDALFEDDETQTLTMSERAANNSALGAVSAVMTALNVISLFLLVIMMLVLGNTVAMGVRERTAEYGMLRALGFGPGHVRRLIVAEALAVACFSGVMGLAVAFPIVDLGIGRWLEENMGKFFPVFRVTPGTAALALGATLAIGAASASVPALLAGRSSVTNALRRLV
jgi:putative ABC transport system permease protein